MDRLSCVCPICGEAHPAPQKDALTIKIDNELLVLERDSESFTNFSWVPQNQREDKRGVPASIFEVELWKKYVALSNKISQNLTGESNE